MDWDDQPAGATPLSEDQREGLKQSWVTTMNDLNDAEAENILAASTKWYRRRNTLSSLLDDNAVRDLHRDMLGDVWTWAGTYRLRELNIGIDPFKVPVAVQDLVDDAEDWFDASSDRDLDLAAIRFHHRLVALHRSRTATGDTPGSSPTSCSAPSASRPSRGAAAISTPPVRCAPGTSPPYVWPMAATTKHCWSSCAADGPHRLSIGRVRRCVPQGCTTVSNETLERWLPTRTPLATG